MPTPDWVREAARKKRERVCLICGVHFLAPRPTYKGLCSKECRAVNYSRVMTGTRQSEETKAKRITSMAAFRKANPEKEAARIVAAKAAMRTPEYIQGAYERYLTMKENGTGICSEENKAHTAEINKWVLKRAQEALRNETDYTALWNETQARLRREMPYDGPLDSSDYVDYLQKLGRATTSDPQLCQMHTDFMKIIIPRCYEEWRAKKKEEQDASISSL